VRVCSRPRKRYIRVLLYFSTITNSNSTSIELKLRRSYTLPLSTKTLISNTYSSNMADNNPANFANRPKEEVREIAAKGGRASHGGGNNGGHETGAAASDVSSYFALVP
jgi:hypothetical protein